MADDLTDAEIRRLVADAARAVQDQCTANWRALAEQVAEVNRKLARVIVILDGDPDQDVKGLRPRVRSIEDLLEPLRSVKLILGVLGVTNLAALIGLITILLGIIHR